MKEAGTRQVLLSHRTVRLDRTEGVAVCRLCTEKDAR